MELGGFTLAVTLGDPSNNVGLTDDNGNTFMYKTGDVTDEIAASTEHPYATVAVGLTLSYQGDLATAAEKDAVWQANVPASVTITITDTSTAYDATEAPNGVKEGEGLKFKKDAAFTKTTGGYAGSSSVSWTILNTALDDLHFSETPVLSLSVGTLYVAVKGVDGLAQSASTIYNIHADIA